MKAACPKFPTALIVRTTHIAERVEPGLPSLKPPYFEIVEGNRTVSFMEMATELKSGIFVIPIVAVLINVSIAKAFGK